MLNLHSRVCTYNQRKWLSGFQDFFLKKINQKKILTYREKDRADFLKEEIEVKVYKKNLRTSFLFIHELFCLLIALTKMIMENKNIT